MLFYIGWLDNPHPMITFLPTVCRKLTPRPRVMVEFTNTGGAEPTKRLTRWAASWPSRGAADGGSTGGTARSCGTRTRSSLSAQRLDELLEFHPPAAGRGTVIPAPPLLRPVEDPDGSVRRRTREKLAARDYEFIVASLATSTRKRASKRC